MTTGLPSEAGDRATGDFRVRFATIEDVVVDARARPPRIAVIADGDALSTWIR